MVFFNNKKFACESCIKGHRSSACHHTDRPLFEIKKKGRPVSQCPKCRELRQSKKLHSKCTCDHKDDAPLMQPLSSSSSSKPRYIPVFPSLPNGLKDVIAASQSSTALPPDSRQRVDSLLNPCNCTDVWKCRCEVSESANSSVPNVQTSVPLGGLATLARAAVMQNSSSDADSRLSLSTELYHSRPATPANIAFRKRQKHRMKNLTRMPGPDLAPIRISPSSSFPPSIPDFPSMPSMSEISLLAGSGCTCGVLCACPGCVEHTTTDTGKRCGDGCGSCIDPSIEVALSHPTPSQAKESTSFLDRFFAQAAALPPPPAHRKMGSYHLDPMNTRIFSQSSSSQPLNFGVVNLPKLDCDGRCDHSSGECGENCASSSSDLHHVLDNRKGKCCGGSVLN